MFWFSLYQLLLVDVTYIFIHLFIVHPLHKKASSLTTGTLFSSLTFPMVRTCLAHRKHWRSKYAMKDYCTAHTPSHFGCPTTPMSWHYCYPCDRWRNKGLEKWSNLARVNHWASKSQIWDTNSVCDSRTIHVILCHTTSLKEMNILSSENIIQQ